MLEFVSTGTRQRIVMSTAELLRRQGYSATGTQQIVDAARSPFGSLYHHFPGGKVEIAAEAIRTAGAAYVEPLLAVIDSQADLYNGLRVFFRLAAEHLEASNFADACPIATVALEVASTNEQLRQATGDVFDGWLHHGTSYFVGRGLSEHTSRDLTIALVSALEGAFVLARATRRLEALDMAAEMVCSWLETHDERDRDGSR
jgi:AcrR family transcriptional regulator